MKTKQLFSLITASAVMFLGSIACAQENEEGSSPTAQVTLAYPLGTNGMNAPSVSNNYSLNVLYGINGGVQGVEVGGIMNFNQGDVSGLQMSGVLNINVGNTQGVMMSSTANISLGGASGVMIADAYNLVTGDFYGIQMASVNNATSHITGAQIGVVNYAKSLNGVQIGIVNILGDGEEGIPIGLVNIVRNGYYELEILSGDALITNLNYKMGTEHFYTIFKMGFSTYRNRPVYSAGFGAGTMVSITENQRVSFDLSISELVYDHDWKASDENYLTKLDINYRLGLGSNISLVAGPSFNLYVSDVMVDDHMGTLKIPRHAHTILDQDNQKWMWVGFNAGLAYRF